MSINVFIELNFSFFIPEPIQLTDSVQEPNQGKGFCKKMRPFFPNKPKKKEAVPVL